MPKRKSQLFPFQNEREFEEKFLISLLLRLGFTIVQQNHGTREFGRDLIIAEADRFGEYRYHGIQTKFEDIGQGNAIESIINDAKEAFRNPFQHKISGDEAHISTFYVINGGLISDQARTQFFRALVPYYASNVKLISGEFLRDMVPIDIPLLKGLLLEVNGNREKLSQFVTEPAETQISVRLRQSAVSAFLIRPTIDELQSPASRYRDCVDQFNHVFPIRQKFNGITIDLQNVLGSGETLITIINSLITHGSL